MRFGAFAAICVCMLVMVQSAAVSAEFLTRKGTELYMGGKPFRAVSVNKFDIALQFLRGGADREAAVRAIKDVAAHGFRVIRFGAVGFYPKDMELWPNDLYWKRMDDLVDTARDAGVLLIPVLNWNTYLFPDMAHETVQDMLTNRDSKSRQYVELYIYQMVSRYKSSPTILFWEIWSELNLGADLEFMRPYGYSELNWVSVGAAPMRVRRDNYTTAQMIPFLRDIAKLIRGIDPNHLISSGNSSPRPAAQHLRVAKGKGDWTEDTPDEAETYLRDTHPDPIDLISIHFYSGIDNTRFEIKDLNSASCLRTLKRICDRIGKPVYIGEGGGEAYKDPDGGSQPFTRNMINEAVAAGYPIILYWMWGPDDPLRFDLSKSPSLNKLLFDADKTLNMEK